jgi:NAD(P)-dependent dehydrogenase (short-subunit alcohol dehydrogenase family)
VSVDIAGCASLVTGGASGIGRATAELLASRGAHVGVLDVDAVQGEEVAESIGGLFIRTDVGDPVQMQRAVDTCVATFGGLDISVLNAGIGLHERGIDRLTDEEYRRIMRVNVDGVVFGLRASIDAMQRRRGGSVVVTASLAGLVAHGREPLYAATKHFAIGLVRGVARQLEGQRPAIQVNCICPGGVDTAIVGTRARAAFAKAGFPLMPPREIAESACHIITAGGTGQAWICQYGRDPLPYEFRGVPGPRGDVPLPPEISFAV